MFGSDHKEPEFKFNLGDKAKDIITGFEGVIIYRTQWINNCNVYGIKSQTLKDGLPLESKQFDEPQLELIEDKVIPESRRTGGPNDSPSEPNRQ